MKFTKKASLDLSINAIVVLILAIIFLGMGIVFVKNIFDTMGSSFESGFDAVTKQRIDQIKTSDKVFDIETYNVDLRQGGREVKFMLLRNTESTAQTWNIVTDAGSPIGEPNICGSVKIASPSSIDVLAKSDIVPPLLINVDKVTSKGTCTFGISAKIGAETKATAQLTVNII